MDHPKYEEASQADINAVKGGNWNFKGIGLPEGLYTECAKAQRESTRIQEKD
jgi:hypothetical protein